MRRNQTIWILTVVAISLFSLAAITGKAFTQNMAPAVSNSRTIFQPILSEIVKSGVPLRLPTYIPARSQRLNNAEKQPDKAYATVSSITDGMYTVIVGYTQDCTGGTSCRLGTVQGDRKMTETKRIEEVYSFMQDPKFKGIRSKETMVPVTLARNTSGWFIPWICGANCNDAKVVWDEGAYRYMVGIKLGDKNSLVEMANSAINHQS